MTIYWNPNDDVDPTSIEIWHVSDDGTVSGPLTVDTSGVSGMPDTFGGVAPDAVRGRIGQFLKSHNPTQTLWQEVAIDLWTLDYERGTPP